MEKDFTKWHCLKTNLQKIDRNLFFRDRDIWLCSVGMNLGHEEDGKGSRFLRPVIIFRKFTNDFFLGIPLTTKEKEGSFYYRSSFAGRPGSAMVYQAKVMDRKRLLRKMGVLSQEQFGAIKKIFKKLFLP
jgi:mRNA interferase MazF